MSGTNESQNRPKPEPPETERQFSQGQYHMLKRCSEAGDMAEWNEWRKEHGDEPVLLQGARFDKANLQNADLLDANLRGASLMEARLTGSNLTGADLREANLWQADLQEVQLGLANLQRAILRDTDLRRVNLLRTDLQGAELERADLRRAHLLRANLQNAGLVDANLRGASLVKANLKGARLLEANLSGAVLTGADLSGADSSRAIVDGGTLMWNFAFDHRTKFEGVGLESMRIYPREKALLEYNIRRMNWEEWYGGRADPARKPRLRGFITAPVRAFWFVSDYGLSTVRIVVVFFLLAFAFAAVYASLATCYAPGAVSNLHVEPHLPLWHYFLLLVLRPVYFSIVTMTTLGFGDMYAESWSIAGHILLILQVLLGYVLLGALVTRLAVLFTAGGPVSRSARKVEWASDSSDS